MRFLGHMLRKEGLVNLTLTGYSEGKRRRGKREVAFLARLCKWSAEQGIGGMVNGKMIPSATTAPPQKNKKKTGFCGDRPRPDGKWYIKKNILTFVSICLSQKKPLLPEQLVPIGLKDYSNKKKKNQK